MSRPPLFVSIGVVFALHNLEEGVAAPRLLALMQSRAPAALQAFYAGITPSDLRFSLTMLTLAGILLAIAAARAPTNAAWTYTMLVFACVIGLNAGAHMVMSAIFGAYVPGLITAITLTLPIAMIALVRAWRGRWVPRGLYWTIVPAAALVHGPVLVLFIRASIGGFRTLSAA